MNNKELKGKAYAEFDNDTGVLRIFRDDEGKYSNKQTDGMKTYYAGIEDIEEDTNPKWFGKRVFVRKVVIEDTFRPKTAFQMFDEMINLTEIEGIENLDTSECTNMSDMFYECWSLTGLNVSHFDTSKVTDTSYMFAWCRELTNLDVSHFDTFEVMSMNSMFSHCSNLTELDLSRWDTSRVLHSTAMFLGCDDIQTVYVSDTNEFLMRNLLRSNSKAEVKVKDNHHFIAGDDGYIERAEGAKRNPLPSTKDSDHYFTADYNGDKGWNIKEFDAEGNEVTKSKPTKDSDHYFTADYNGEDGWNIKEFDAEGNEVTKSKKENPQKTFSETKADVVDEIDKIINDLIAMKNKYISSNDADSLIEAYARGNDGTIDIEGR